MYLSTNGICFYNNVTRFRCSYLNFLWGKTVLSPYRWTSRHRFSSDPAQKPTQPTCRCHTLLVYLLFIIFILFIRHNSPGFISTINYLTICVSTEYYIGISSLWLIWCVDIKVYRSSHEWKWTILVSIPGRCYVY